MAGSAGSQDSDTRVAVGDTAPDFTLPNSDGTPVTLSSYRGRKVIVYFYPAASTPGCTREANDFEASLSELQAAGYEVIGISPDKPDTVTTFRSDGGYTYPLLCDPDREVLEEWGAYGEKNVYGKTVIGVIRSTFVVDENGVVTHAMRGVRATGHVAKLRRDLGV